MYIACTRYHRPSNVVNRPSVASEVGRGSERRRIIPDIRTGRGHEERAMPVMTGGEAIVKSLARDGVHVVFGLPGVQLYGVLAALRDEPGMRFITCRHEG